MNLKTYSKFNDDTCAHGPQTQFLTLFLRDPLFLRDHLFVTKRVAVRVGNFLIGASFFSDRPHHFWFRPKKIGFGAAGHFSLHLNFLTKNNFFFQIYFFGERPKS